MERIGVRELRQNASQWLARVKDGHTVEITERGVLVALLVSPDPAVSARDRLVKDGRLIPALSPTGRLSAPRPIPSGPGEPTNEQLLADERDERL